MAATWEIWLATDRGQRLTMIDGAQRFGFARAVNSAGSFYIILPTNWPAYYSAAGRLVFFWRKGESGANRLEFAGVVTGWQIATDDRGDVTRTLYGAGLNDLLRRRVVAYAAESAQAAQTNEADDLMKQIVRENLGSSATAARQLSATYFAVAPDLALGPSIRMAFSYRNVLDVLRDISDAARQAGTRVYFEIVATSESTFEFQTFIGRRGLDLTTSGARLGDEFGNIQRGRLTVDYSGEVNFAYALGQGLGALRMVGTAEDTARSGATIWSRAEDATNANTESTAAGLADVADRRVVAGRPRQRLEATIVDTAGARYGVEWSFGDQINLTFDGAQYTALINALTAEVDGLGRETLTGQLETL
jgi:hypothetical protein